MLRPPELDEVLPPAQLGAPAPGAMLK